MSSIPSVQSYRRSSTSHRRLVAFLVRFTGGEVAVAEGGAGATGDVTSLEDGGWSDIKSGRGAFVAKVAPVWARLLRRRRRSPSAGALVSVDEAMIQQEMVISWLPAWCRMEIRACSLASTQRS
jgi:hypothetical protein